MTGEEREKKEEEDAPEQNGLEGLARPGEVDGRAIFLGWEKLRIPFNLALAFPVLSIFVVSWLGPWDFVEPGIVVKRFGIMLFFYVIAANVLYFAGPIAETYVAWLARKTYMFELRLCLFIAGTIASLCAAGLCTLKYSQFFYLD